VYHSSFFHIYPLGTEMYAIWNAYSYGGLYNDTEAVRVHQWYTYIARLGDERNEEISNIDRVQTDGS
jgi:hypothetical protein